jgi:hypothetical protein
MLGVSKNTKSSDNLIWLLSKLKIYPGSVRTKLLTSSASQAFMCRSPALLSFSGCNLFVFRWLIRTWNVVL